MLFVNTKLNIVNYLLEILLSGVQIES